MQQKWQRWNLASRKWLWIIVVVGVIAALPVVYDRLQTEKSSKTVEFVFDYRDLVEVASYRQNPQDYISEQLDRLKAAGVQSMAIYENTLEDFRKARRLMLWGASDEIHQHADGCSFAGSIRAEKAEDFPFLHIKRYIINNPLAADLFADSPG